MESMKRRARPDNGCHFLLARGFSPRLVLPRTIGITWPLPPAKQERRRRARVTHEELLVQDIDHVDM